MCDLKLVLLGFALWNTTFCSSGVVFGFAALGIPSEVFLVSGGPMFSLATAIIGPLVDTFGPRAASVGGTALAALGYLALAYSKANEASALCYIGLALVVFGGIGPYLGSFCVGALFKTPEVPISIITGIFSLGGLAYEAFGRLGLSRQNICFTFMGLQVLGMILGVLGYPAKPHLPGKPSPVLLERVLGIKTEAALPPGSPVIARSPLSPTSPAFNGAVQEGVGSDMSLQPRLLQATSDSSLPPCSPPTSPSALPRSPLERPPDSLSSRPIGMIMPRYWQQQQRQAEKERLGLLGRARRASRRFSDLRTVSAMDLTAATFWGQALSAEYMGIVVWYSLNLTWILYYFTYAGPIVNDELFCRMVGYVGNAVPTVLALVVGNVIARWGWGFATMLTSLLSIGMLVLSTLHYLWLDYVALVFFSIARSMVFAVFFSYIPMTFGAANYGRLIGAATLVSGAFGFVNTPLGQWASFVHSPEKSQCQMGTVCESQAACNRTSFAMAICLAPMVMYSVWLCGRSSGEERRRSGSGMLTPTAPESPRSPSEPIGIHGLESALVGGFPEAPIILKSESTLVDTIENTQ